MTKEDEVIIDFTRDTLLPIADEVTNFFSHWTNSNEEDALQKAFLYECRQKNIKITREVAITQYYKDLAFPEKKLDFFIFPEQQNQLLPSGIFIETNVTLEPLSVAKIISSIATKEKFDLILLGKQAIDDDMNATGQMTAALLGWAQATFASKVEIKDNIATVSREVDGGIENIEVNLPAVISTDLRLNEPRYASLPNIMKAKKKPIQQLSVEELNINIENRLNILKVEEPAKRQSGVMLQTVDELVEKLKNEAKVI